MTLAGKRQKCGAQHSHYRCKNYQPGTLRQDLRQRGLLVIPGWQSRYLGAYISGAILSQLGLGTVDLRRHFSVLGMAAVDQQL